MDKCEKLRIKLENRYAKHRALHQKLREHAEDILSSEKFKSTRDNVQHGSIHVHRHSIDVAKQSLIISKALHLKVNEKEMVRGALLHDYFLYDWHNKDREDYKVLHGFYHPGIALKNAKKDFNLTEREQDIIKKHMWPLTLVYFPRYKESWVVTMADKYCSTLETLKIRKGVIGSRLDRHFVKSGIVDVNMAEDMAKELFSEDTENESKRETEFATTSSKAAG